MGDYADDAVNRALGFFSRPRRKRPSDRAQGSAYGPPPECKHCHRRDVYWQNVKGEWRLANKQDLTPHNCLNETNINAEGFDDVD